MRERLRAWRSRAAPREQALVALAAALVVGALGYTLLVEPLGRDLAATEAALVAARGQLAGARAQAAAIAAAPKTQTLPAGDARAGVERALDELRLRPSLTSLQAKDGRIELTFEAIDFATLTALVDMLAREARLQPVEALVAARTQPGSVRAEIAFARDR